jgi:peptide/nickel transport system permease protein
MPVILRWILRRLALATAVLLGVVTLLFGIFSLLGDPARDLAGQRTDPETLAAIRAQFRLDQPLHQRYLAYLHDLSPIGLVDAGTEPSAWRIVPLAGNTWLALKAPSLGVSFQRQESVAALYASRLPGTVLLAGASLLVALGLGLGLGVAAALRRGSWLDATLGLVSLVGISMPSFFAAVVAIWLFAIQWGDWTGLPLTGYVRREAVLGDGWLWQWSALVLPAATLGLRPLAVFFQLMRDSLSDVLAQDYIRTARAKGLGPSAIVWRHALRPALNPVLTSATGWLASLLAGAFFVEYLFDWPGVGKLTLDALQQNDYPLLLGCCLLTAALFVVIHLLTDLLYAALDPRVRAT